MCVWWVGQCTATDWQLGVRSAPREHGLSRTTCSARARARTPFSTAARKYESGHHCRHHQCVRLAAGRARDVGTSFGGMAAQDQGGCEHYRRKVDVLAPCCGGWFT